MKRGGAHLAVPLRGGCGRGNPSHPARGMGAGAVSSPIDFLLVHAAIPALALACTVTCLKILELDILMLMFLYAMHSICTPGAIYWLEQISITPSK